MRTARNISITLVAILAFLGLCGTVPAAELYVPANYSTIQEAIDASVSGDVIIVADGTYTGPENKNLDFAGRAITLMSENGPDNCIIDCEGSGRGFIFQSGEDGHSVINGFTITNGQSTSGAGMRIIGSSPSILNCLFIENSTSGHGGGIYFHSSQAQIVNCKFLNNSATDPWSAGGAMILYYSDLVIKNCLFVGNRCPNVAGGGAMRNWESAPTLINCTFSANSSSFAPIDNNPDSHPVFINCIFWGNLSSRTIWSHSGSCATLVFCDVEGGWNGPKVSGCVIDGGGNINADPNFVDATNPDIYARDYHLSEGSPCIDAGSDGGVDFDLDGVPRPIDYPDVDNNGELPDFDIGAYEVTRLFHAIVNIDKALAEKAKSLEAIDAAHEKEMAACEILEELLTSGDYGDLQKTDIARAKRQINSAMRQQGRSSDILQKSIEKLDDASGSLGY